MHYFKLFIDFMFGAGLFINAMLFVPQAMKLIKSKNAKDLSIITFIGFLFMQGMSVIYGYITHDYILMFGYLLSLLTCGFVTVLIFLYKSE